MEKIDFKKQNIPFTQVANGVIYDKRISLGAKTIYAYMYSKPDGWDFASDRIAKELNVSKPTVLKHIKELKEFGYLISKKLSNGRILYKIIFPPIEPEESIFTLAEKPKSKKATVKKSHSEKSLPISNKEFKVIKSISNKDSKVKTLQRSNFIRSKDFEVKSVIRLWKDINPMYSEWYSNKTQQRAILGLIEAIGVLEVRKLVLDIPRLCSKPYYPKITTPLELKNNYAKLKQLEEQEKAIKSNGNKTIKLI